MAVHRGSTSQRPGDHRGFTLTEIMVALVIAGILMLIALPNLQRANTNQILRSETSQIENALRRARAKAVKTRTAVRVSINPDLRSCVMEQDSDDDGNFDLQVASFEIAEQIDVATMTLGAGNGSVVFNSRGVPDAPGLLEMFVPTGNGRQIMVSAGSGSVVVNNIQATASP